MTDRELLELAAKAAGYEVFESGWTDAKLCLKTGEPEEDGDMPPHVLWNPLDDDCDALRLAAKLGLRVDFSYMTGADSVRGVGVWTPIDRDDCACPPFWTAEAHDSCLAARQTIVRAAAEIGKAMS